MFLLKHATALLLVATLLVAQTSLAFAKDGTPPPPQPSLSPVPPGVTVQITDKMSDILNFQ